MIWTAAFWRGAGERAIKTFVQTFAAVLFLGGLSQVVSPSEALAMPWASSLVTGALAALLSLLTSLGNAEFTAGRTEQQAVSSPDTQVIVNAAPPEVQP